MNIRHIVFLAALMAAPTVLVGCGEKKPAVPVDGEMLPPAKAFENGVSVLQAEGETDFAAAYSLFKMAVDGKPDFADRKSVV